jgi:hypothetical protein
MKIVWRLQDPRREAIYMQFIITMYGVHAAGQISPLSYNHVLPHMIFFPKDHLIHGEGMFILIFLR